MKGMDGVYVIDGLENIGRYAGIGRNFAKACEFIARGDFASLVPGRNAIDGDAVFVNRDEANYVARGERRGELHRRYFDIHIPLDADECIGFARLDASASVDFDDARDFASPPEQPLEWVAVRRGEFAICWPGTCVHAPAVAVDVPKTAVKLIVKIEA